MALSPTLQAALSAAITNWHHAQRAYEQAARVFADAETQRQIAERDLHELARAIEAATGADAAELVSNAAAPIGGVTMPIVPANGSHLGPTPPPADDGLDAAAIVLQELQKQRGVMP